jgi:hypothetical protein
LANEKGKSCTIFGELQRQFTANAIRPQIHLILDLASLTFVTTTAAGLFLLSAGATSSLVALEYNFAFPSSELRTKFSSGEVGGEEDDFISSFLVS